MSNISLRTTVLVERNTEIQFHHTLLSITGQHHTYTKVSAHSWIVLEIWADLRQDEILCSSYSVAASLGRTEEDHGGRSHRLGGDYMPL
jgi:hypothetical protein